MTSWWAGWRLKSPAPRLFTPPLIQAQIKEHIKAPRHWPLWGEFTGHRWIPHTKGQWRGKCFHLMTSSWPPEIWSKWVSFNRQTFQIILIGRKSLLFFNISLKLVTMGPICNNSSLVKVMAWGHTSHMPKHEAVRTNLYGVMPAWFNL